MKTTRRDFIRQSGSAVLGASMLGSLAPEMVFADEKSGELSPPTLLIVYLRGGADPLHTIVPYGDPLYQQMRPTIGIPSKDGKDPADKGVIRLNRMFGLNPVMAPLYPLFQQGMVAPIINVGSPHRTRSHFDAQDFMEYAAPGIRTITEGWLNRYLTATKKKGNADSALRALAMQTLLPRAMRGDYPVLAYPGTTSGTSLDAFDKIYGSCKEDAAMNRAMSQKEREDAVKRDGAKSEREARHSIVQSGRSTIRTLRRLERILKASKGTKQAKYPGTGFGRQMQGIAQVIKADVGLEIAAVDYRGWDHHARQGGNDGTFSRMMGDVSSVLAAFAADLGPRMNRTLVLTMSEFGRTVRENGNNGSDHGHGGFMLAMGGMIQGKRIYGKWTGLEKSKLWQGRDMPVHTDFRLVFAEVLARL